MRIGMYVSSSLVLFGRRGVELLGYDGEGEMDTTTVLV